MSQSTLTERLGIVGSGAIARGLAKTADTHPGVVMWARSEHSAERARERLGAHVDVVTDIADLANSTLVIEAVVEDLEVKRELFAQLDEAAPDARLLASNTSSIPIASGSRPSPSSSSRTALKR